MYVEITKEAFKRLINVDTKCDKVENKEYGVRYYYISPYGVMLLHVNNFLSCTNQYYIQDINA